MVEEATPAPAPDPAATAASPIAKDLSLFYVFKHLTTLNVAALGLLFTLADRFDSQRVNASFVASVFQYFMFSLLISLIGMVGEAVNPPMVSKRVMSTISAIVAMLVFIIAANAFAMCVNIGLGLGTKVEFHWLPLFYP